MHRETPVRFGPRHELIGVTTVPSADGTPALGCLLFNSGVLHRVGPHRFNVKLARALARHGVASIRFDLSGLGDSRAVPGAPPGREQIVRDMQAAMDFMTADTGVERFIVVGICSGAVNGYELALADPRVIGLLMFDGFVYRTLKTHVMRRWLRFRAMSWGALLGRVAQRLASVARRIPARPAGLFDAAGAPSTPPREEFRRAMDSLAARGTSLYIAYSGSFVEEYNYEGQLRDAFAGARFLERLRLDYMPDVDHTFTALAAQRTVVAAVCDWVSGIAAAARTRATTSTEPISGSMGR
jgi:pimeloyl-ACP methyl ester carboxylesterase